MMREESRHRWRREILRATRRVLSLEPLAAIAYVRHALSAAGREGRPDSLRGKRITALPTPARLCGASLAGRDWLGAVEPPIPEHSGPGPG